jgi:alpha-ketoglutaric semialdehyde dehydrogenase
MTRTVTHYIGGKWVEGGKLIQRENPSDLKDIVATVPMGGEREISAAVSSASDAFPDWSNVSPEVRADCLDRIGLALMARSDAIGESLAREEGKLLAEAIGEVRRASRIFRYFAGEALRTSGQALRSVRAGVDIDIQRESVGVFGLITPWNFPIAIPAWKSAPALAFGNTVVLKPSSLSPIVAVTLAEIVHEAGVPAGVFNLVFGEAEAGSALCKDEAVSGISFTGSQAVGRQVAKAAMSRQAKVQLEMGGKNPLIILDDADLDRAVEIALDGSFYSCGQRCTASSRLIVEGGIHDAFVERLSARLGSLKVGPALDPKSQIGPLSSRAQIDKSLLAIKTALKDGASLLAGGEKVSEAGNGYFLRPALLGNTVQDMQINQLEVFGPVASVIRADDFDHAIAIANASAFGLSAGIASQSSSRIRQFKREIKAGMVMVNLPTAGVDYHVPFGGTRASSYGPREQGGAAIEFYTQLKTAYVWS